MGGLCWLGILILAVYGLIAVDVLTGSRKLHFLWDVPPALPATPPSVSLIADNARCHGFSPWYAAGFPVTATLFAYIVLRTAILNHRHDGITWRGTFYPLTSCAKTGFETLCARQTLWNLRMKS